MSNLPLLFPALAVGLVLAVLASQPLGRALEMPAWAAFTLVASIVLVVAVTLTPRRETAGAVDLFASVPATESPVGPELWRWPWQWWPVDDRTLNIALFVPLGLAVGLVGRRRARRVLAVLALVSPLLVEGTQHVVNWLARDSQWQDVVDNATGVIIGLVIGVLIRRAVGAADGAEQRTYA